MTSHTLRRLSDIDQVSLTAAEEFVRVVQKACLARKRCTVVLAGGFTPKLLYQHLVERTFRRQVDWSMVHFFWSDERTVPPNHHDSNFGMANETLLQSLALPKDQIHRMHAERPDLDLAASEYQTELAQVCRVSADGEPPVLDLVLLGMGRDGHTASLFPFSAALNETRRWVVANTIPKSNDERMTMTPVILNKADRILFLVAGADKATALAHVLEGDEEPEEYPAKMIQPSNGTVIWLVDESAASKLKKRH